MGDGKVKTATGVTNASLVASCKSLLERVKCRLVTVYRSPTVKVHIEEDDTVAETALV